VQQNAAEESEGVLRLNSLEPLFDKEGLMEFGDRGLIETTEAVLRSPAGAALRPCHLGVGRPQLDQMASIIFVLTVWKAGTKAETMATAHKINAEDTSSGTSTASMTSPKGKWNGCCPSIGTTT
jgi:hypothetical protein